MLGPHWADKEAASLAGSDTEVNEVLCWFCSRGSPRPLAFCCGALPFSLHLPCGFSEAQTKPRISMKKLIPFLYFSTQNDTVPHPCLPRWLLIIHLSCYQLQQLLDENPAYMVAQMVRSPGEGNGNPCQYSCLENSMDRGVWRAIAHVVAKSQTG